MPVQATTPHWCFGADNSGDIRRPANIQALWQEAARMCQQQQSGQPARIMLVTADGAIDSSANPNEQEEATAALHMCEMLAAVGLLSVGGAFVIKVTSAASVAFAMLLPDSKAIQHCLIDTGVVCMLLGFVILMQLP